MSSKSSTKSTKSSSKFQEPLKQGALSFATVKRIASSNATSKAKSLKPAKSAPIHKTSNSVDSTEDDFDDIELHVSDDEDEDEIQDSSDVDKKPTPSGTRDQTRVADKHTTAKKSSQEQKPVVSVTARLGTIPLKASKDDVSKTVSADEKLELDIKDRKWNKHYAEVRKKMGHLPPGESIGLSCLRQTLIIFIIIFKVHAENQNKIHEILRVFDL